MRIAIIGTGIAGNAAAWALARHNSVTVYEKDARAGGHSHTVDVDYDGRRIAVDTGFIVYNEHNYPNLTALFDYLDVPTAASDMSFSVSAENGFEWAGKPGKLPRVLDGVFAQRSNLVSPTYIWMLVEMFRFNREASADRAAGRLAGITLGEYMAKGRFSQRLLADYLVPMGAAIWSMPVGEMMRFPAENFVAFFENHALLRPDRPVWRTVAGGSRAYVERLTASFRDRIRLGTPAVRIERNPTGVTVTDAGGNMDSFDQVVIATHTDQALRLLVDASAEEREILGDIGYRANDVWLHRDARLMPTRRKAWASWNFLRRGGRSETGAETAVTYWMNSLQPIDPACPVFVSLNPPFEPDPKLTFGRFSYEHPQYDAGAFRAQKRLATIQGVRRTWFCGAWAGYGFHEDGLAAGLSVAEGLGASIPWRPSPPTLAEAAE